ncbi:MAG: HAD family hydrolase [Haloferacaceae archaeon]
MATIHFDLDGTLLRLERSYEELFATACEAAGARPADVAAASDFYTERLFEHFRGLADEPYRRAVGETVAEFRLDADPDALARALLDAEIEGLTVPPGTRDALSALADEHVLGVLTNGVGDVQRAKLAAHDLAAHFDAVVASHDVGALKPAAAIFEHARERLPADRHVYVGDSAAHDVVPAAELGFGTVHVVEDVADGSDAADAVIEPGEYAGVGDVVA